jgi:hypothetical protein
LTWKKDQGSGDKTKELYKAYRSRHAAFYQYLVVRPNPELWPCVSEQVGKESSSSSSSSAPPEEAAVAREEELKEIAKRYRMFAPYRSHKEDGRQSSSSSSSSSKSSADQAAAASLIDLSQAPCPPQQKKKPCRGPLTSLAKDASKAANMKAAIEEVQQAGGGAIISRIAKKHHVSDTSLRRQLGKANPTDFRRLGPQSIFGDVLEELLLEYIYHRHSMGQPLRWPRLQYLAAAWAKDLARSLPPSTYRDRFMEFQASRGWLQRFCERHKEVLTSRRAITPTV